MRKRREAAGRLGVWLYNWLSVFGCSEPWNAISAIDGMLFSANWWRAYCRFVQLDEKGLGTFPILAPYILHREARRRRESTYPSIHERKYFRCMTCNESPFISLPR
jgi:hypothetical protein